MTVVHVCGDSTATPFGLSPADAQQAFPYTLRRALVPSGGRLMTSAKSGCMVDESLAKIDRIVAARPDVIVVAHGGRECLFIRNRRLSLIWTDPTSSIPRSGAWPLRYLKRFAYRMFLASLRTAIGPLAIHSLGLMTHMSSEEFGATMNDLIKSLLTQTNASILIVVPAAAEMTLWPWDPAALDDVRQTLSALPAISPRVQTLDVQTVLEPGFDASCFQADGVHYSVEGHRRLAGALSEQISVHRRDAAPVTEVLP